MKKFLAIAIASTVLTGCGDNAVEQVQNLPINSTVEYSYGKVLNNRHVCEKVDWKAETIDGIKTVTYTCLLNKGKKFINYDQNEVEVLKKKTYAEVLESIKKTHKWKYDASTKDLEEAHRSINYLKEIRDTPDFMTAISSSGFLSEAFYIFLKSPEGKPYYDRLKEILQSPHTTPEVALHYFLLLNEETASKTIHDLDNEFKPTVHQFYIKEVEKVIAEFEEKKTLAEERIKVHGPDVIDDEDKKLLDKSVEYAVNNYEKTHSIRGEEKVVWEYNSVMEKYILTKSTFVMKFKNYEDVKYNFSMPHAIYAATHNINNVDEYLDYRLNNRD